MIYLIYFYTTQLVCDPLPIADLSHVEASCNGDGSIEDKVCNVTCEDGFDISMGELPEYRCGLSTNYMWTQTNGAEFDLSLLTCTGKTMAYCF